MFTRLVNALSLATFASFAALPSQAAQEKPNIVFILSDDAGYADFGFNGAEDLRTPNIDRLATEGVVFTEAYVTASVCAPSRMGLVTGRYQQRFGAECNVPVHPTVGYDETDLGLDVEEHTIGDTLQGAGYRTMLIGKWHLGELPQYHPLKRGFDEFYGFLGGSRSYWSIENPHEGSALMHDYKVLDEEQEVTYLTEDLTDAAIDFVERQRDTPFFLYLSYNAVHTPMEAKEEDIEQLHAIDEKNRRVYAAMTKSMDENIGRFLQRLDELQLAENTLVVFVNDNGGATNNRSRNNPLRGYKGSYWEGGIRIPLVARWPGRLAPGTTYTQAVSTLDLLPTSAAAGQAKHTGKDLDGVNLMPYLTGECEKPPHEYLFWRLWRAAAVRHGKWKLIRVSEDPLHENKKLLAPLILVDLENDPEEAANVAEQNPEIAASLLAALEDWEEGLGQPRWYDGDDWPRWADVQVDNHQMDTKRYH